MATKQQKLENVIDDVVTLIEDMPIPPNSKIAMLMAIKLVYINVCVAMEDDESFDIERYKKEFSM